MCNVPLLGFQSWVQNPIRNSCHDLAMLCLDLSDFTIITVKAVGYRYTIHGFSKSEVIHLLKKYVWRSRIYEKCMSKKLKSNIESTTIILTI